MGVVCILGIVVRGGFIMCYMFMRICWRLVREISDSGSRGIRKEKVR